jgi:AraC-like DNA-binding protein
MIRRIRRLADSGTVRAAGLLGFEPLVEELGGRAQGLLRSAGIDPQSLASPDNRISYASMIRLLEDASVRLRCPDFGLRLSALQDIRILGPAAMIALYSETVGECLRAVATYFYVHATGGTVAMVPGEDARSHDLTFEILMPGLHAKRQINELSLGIGQTLLEMIIAPGFRSGRIQFTHRRPADLGPLQRRFGTHLEFDCPVNAIAIPDSVLGQPVATSNRDFRRVAVQYVREHISSDEHDRASRVRLIAHQLLPTGRCTLESVADVMAMHPRSLQRELRALGTDFRGILDAVRRELAADYLSDTDASLGQVAAMLGYSDQAAFTNAFRRWFGVSPGRWRGISGRPSGGVAGAPGSVREG